MRMFFYWFYGSKSGFARVYASDWGYFASGVLEPFYEIMLLKGVVNENIWV